MTKETKGFALSPKRGFTLMEILVVVAIVGVLAAVVVASISGIRSKSRDAKRVADLKQLHVAVQNYFSNCSRYPSDLNDINDVSSCNPNPSLQAIPEDPQGDEYGYYVTSVIPYSFHLCATLENEVPSGKAGEDRFDSSDPCRGDQSEVFDLVGGAIN